MTVCSMHIVMYEKDIHKFNEVNHKIHKILHVDGVQNATVQPEFIGENELEYVTENEFGKLVPLNLSCGCKNACEDVTCCSTSRNSLSKKRDSLQKQRPSLESVANKFEAIEENIKEVEIELGSVE
jgi:hypothetical protein